MRLYSVGYNGQFIGQSGLITNIALSTGCFRISENYIQIFRDRPVNHTILFSNNDTIQKLCLTKSGSIARLKSSFTGKTGYVYLVIDKANKIVTINNTPNIDIEKLQDGDYRVFGLSYTGNLNVKLGNIFKSDENFASSCFRLSSNAVRFYKGGFAEGGTISTYLSSNTLFSCPQDGVADLFDVLSPNNPVGTRYQILITDSLNRLYYAPFENQLINFNNTPAGIYKIYGVAFTGDLGYQLGSSILSGSLVNTCYDLSENYIDIFHVKPEGGQISKKDGTTGKTTITFNNNQIDSISLRVTNAKPINVPYTFVLVNENNMIVALSKEKFDLDTLKIGKYSILGIASTNPGISITLGKVLSETVKTENCILLSTNSLALEIIPQVSDPILNRLITYSEKQPIIAFSAFPNPVNDILNLHIVQDENKQNTADIRISHISGKIIYESKTTLSKGTQMISIPMGTYPTGLYILTIETEERKYTGKIIKAEKN
jgi:hypothetical protein